MVDALNHTALLLKGLDTVCTQERLLRVSSKARLALLDYLGCTIAGAFVNDDKCKSYIKFSETGTIPVLGTCQKTTLQTAALLNGINSHLLELDDGHRRGALHVGGPIFSALLAVAAREHICADDLIRGIVVGYESSIRLACAIQPDNKLKGYHATGTCGTIGAALGIAAALSYTEEQKNATLATAVTSAAGVLEMQEDDSDLKPYNVGRAAMDAVAAAMIGRAGLKGPQDAIGGKRGFLKVMTDKPKLDFLTDFSSESLGIEQIYQKVYAACRHAHPAIEAALLLQNMISVDEIESIVVEAYSLAVAGHDHQEISGIGSAKMSIPFSVAVALVSGNAGNEAYSEKTIADNRIISLAKKVMVVENKELTALCPNKRASIVTIMTKTGKFTKRVDYPKGEPENPLSRHEVEEKFMELGCYGGLTAEKCKMIIHEIWQKDFSISAIFDMIS